MIVLIIEDDLLLNKAIAHTLTKEGYGVSSATTYKKGLEAFSKQTIDLVLLDINLKGDSGLDLCQEIRKVSHTPIIFITAKDTEEDMIEGFDVGCDDYIAKPFSLVVLKKRVEAMIRRTNKGEEDKLLDKGLMIDYGKKSIAKDGEAIKLTATEFKLVEILSKNRGQVLTISQLLEKLWDVDGNFVEENTLRVHMRRLRMKIEEDPKNPKWIATVFGIGYTWGE